MFKWILGSLLGACSLVLQPSVLQTASTLLTLVIAGALLLLVKRVKHSLLSACIVVISGFLFGFGWTSIHASWRLSQQIPSPENQSVHIIEAEVKSLPVIYPEYCQFKVRVKHSDTPSLIQKKLQLNDYSKQCPYLNEQVWTLTVKLKPIHGPLNQAGFDYERFMFQQAIDGKGYIKQATPMSQQPEWSIGAFRQSIFDALSEFDNAGLFQALTIGEKSSIPKEDREILQQLGLSHLIAISGLHISIIAGGSFWLMFVVLGWVNRLCRVNAVEPFRPALIVSCFVAFCYTALADFSVPTVRALIMWGCVVTALLWQRQAALLSGLKVSLALMLLIDPLAVLSVSFWMSYIAVAVIALVVSGRAGGAQGWRHGLSKLGKIQIAISLTLLLPSLLFFQQATLLGLLVNIIVIPVFSVLVLPLIIVCVILTLFEFSSPLGMLDSALTTSLGWAEALANTLVWLRFEFWLPGWLLCSLMVVMFIIWLPINIFRYQFIGLWFVLVTSYFIQQWASSTQPTMVVFDVGHGLSVLLTDGKTHILYDTGYAATHGSAFESYIEPTLQKLGVQHLDALIISHQDNDHSGGAKKITVQLPVKQVIAGQWANDMLAGLPTKDCVAGYGYKFGVFSLDVLHPKDSTNGRNNDSCVVKITSGVPEYRFSILLPGDIEKSSEYELAADQLNTLSADIVIVPHHGSNSSSTYPFIKRVNPSFAIYATERFSRYNLPSPKVVRRYQDFDIPQIHTGCYGQITYNLATNSFDATRNEAKIWRLPPCEVVEK